MNWKTQAAEVKISGEMLSKMRPAPLHAVIGREIDVVCADLGDIEAARRLLTNDWAYRRTRNWAKRTEWNELVAPRTTAFLRSCQRLLSRFRAAWVVWWDPEILDEPL